MAEFQPVSILVRSIATRVTAETIERALKAGDEAKAERLRSQWQEYTGADDAP